MLHLLRSDFYRLKQGLLLKIYVVVSAAFIAVLFAAVAGSALSEGGFILFGFISGIFDSADLWRFCVLPAIPYVSCAFCPLLTGALFSEERLRNKILAGFTKKQLFFSAFVSCFLPLGILYISASVVCVLCGLLIGFGYGTAYSYVMSFACGLALLAAYCALFVCLTRIAKKRGIGFLACIIALILERLLSEGLTVLGALTLSSGFGAPFAYLFIMVLSLFLPYGTLKALYANGGGYPLYIILAAVFLLLCFFISAMLMRKKEAT